MRIEFLGAACDVTGSQYRIEVNGHSLLLECGLYQGHRADSYDRNLKFHYDISSLEAVILSHAHIDHSGNLPNLVKQGYRGTIFTTAATAALADIMLRDSGHIQESDAEYINKKRVKRNEPSIQPLYTLQDAASVLPHFKPLAYNETFVPVPGVTAHLVDAGHILGSAAIVLDIQEGSRRYRFWFSGDIGRRNLPLIKDPILPDSVDYLLMESTYGDTPKPDAQEAYGAMEAILRRTFARGGKVIIPAFAVGRTQELLFAFNKMISEHDVKPFPVFLDSPLALEATRVFERFPDYLDSETHTFEEVEHHPALDFPQLRRVESAEESKALNFRRDPMVIVAASGMAENGRIVHHLKNNIEDKRNTIVMVGWTAPDTLGRRLVEKQPVVKIFGESMQLNAEVETIHAFSAHAGQDLLVEYVQSTQKTLKKVILVHGDPEPANSLEFKLGEIGVRDIERPGLYSSLVL
jgi:metallo-beta-lactamase family protein